VAVADEGPVALAEPTVATHLEELNAAPADAPLPAVEDSHPPVAVEASDVEESSDSEEAPEEAPEETFDAVAGERPSWMPAPAFATPPPEAQSQPHEPESLEPAPGGGLPAPMTDPFSRDISL